MYPIFTASYLVIALETLHLSLKVFSAKQLVEDRQHHNYQESGNFHSFTCLRDLRYLALLCHQKLRFGRRHEKRVEALVFDHALDQNLPVLFESEDQTRLLFVEIVREEAILFEDESDVCVDQAEFIWRVLDLRFSYLNNSGVFR